MLLARVGDHELQQLPGKPNGLVWHFELSGFPDLRNLCPAGGRCVCNGHLLCSSICGQNPE
jgi:hypothetical protein